MPSLSSNSSNSSDYSRSKCRCPQNGALTTQLAPKKFPIVKRVKFGALDTYVTGSPNKNGDGTIVVLLHGFGAPGDDLVALSQYLNLPPSVHFVFPIAPLTPDLGIPGARAWWQLDLEQITRDQALGKSRNIYEVPKGLSEAHVALQSCLTALQHDWKIPFEKIILGGFSQGATLACDTMLRSRENLAGLVLLSSTIIALDEWKPLMAIRKGLPIFQSHGTEDPILPFQTATTLRGLFRSVGLEVTWQEFVGGHEIPPMVLKKLGEFIPKCLGSGQEIPEKS